MVTPQRRRADRPPSRGHQPDRRQYRAAPENLRFPTWPEQRVQFLTRYAFMILGLIYFHASSEIEPLWLPLAAINTVFAAYLLLNTALLVHAWREPQSLLRYRLAMWVDIAMVTIAVSNDPHAIPPSLLVFTMIVLGNGMRYGMRIFAEALTGCVAGAMAALSLRYAFASRGVTLGLAFVNLFGGIILIYAYALMSRIELSRRRLEEHILADPLTGLMNRRGLFEAAERLFAHAIGRQGRLAVMFADLDKFKAINDTHGHAKGDHVLKHFAGILRHSIRQSDIAARYGGDEFVVIMPDTGMAEANAIARRIQGRLAAWATENRLDISVTIGIGEAPAHGSHLSAVLDRVDQALYQSKSSSKGGGLQCVGAAPV